MTSGNFVHLHVHTEYSLLDGAAPISKLVEAAAKMKMPAIAITDHGSMYGTIQFYNKCKSMGIKPIIGCELYITEDRHSRTVITDRDKSPSHLVLLAKNNEGYKNLSRLSSIGFIEGYYYKPRIDLEVLEKYSEGLICLSACISGPIPRLLLDNNYEGALAYAKTLKNIFKDDFYIELQDHGMIEEKQVNKLLVNIASEIDIKCVATNDLHYIYKDDAEMHDVLLCIQTGNFIDDENRMRFPNNEFYLKSHEEMAKIFDWCPEAITNTLEIANKCDVNFTFKQYQIPEFECPDGMLSPDYLRKITFEGLKKRYGDNLTNEHIERAENELKIIIDLGFADYYLIVADFIQWAKNNDIPVGPGRGSGVGSIVAYCTGITNVDPIKYHLIFERFLNEDRVSMPDFDVDFCFNRRDEVIDYTAQKYGLDHISRIITFNTMQKKGAIQDVGRTYRVPAQEVMALTKKIPSFGADEKNIKINDLLNTSHMNAVPELINLYNLDPNYKKILNIAMKIEGMSRNSSIHAAGVVIYKNPALDTIPLALSKDKVITTQYNMKEVENLGLLKMDFLALMTLTDIKTAHDLVQERTGIDIDFDELGYDDPDVYEMIGRGETDAIFQLESAGMKDFMTELKPQNLEDLIAGISIYRPGPMDNKDLFLKNRKNPEGIKYKHPMLESILKVTSGVMIYQEQAMMVARKLAQYTLTQADFLRAIFSKKLSNEIPRQQQMFVFGSRYENGDLILDKRGQPEALGCVANGISEEIAKDIFSDLAKFASYAFNKSHAAAYAVLSYMTAYYKHHYPVEFMAAVVNNRMEKPDDIKKYMAVLKNMKIKVLPPDINKSSTNYTTEGNSIRYGLGCIKNVGKEAISKYVIDERKKNGPFKSFYDFMSRVDSKFRTKTTIESMIWAGVFDCFPQNRATLISNYKLLETHIIADEKQRESGQINMFAALDLNTSDIFEYAFVPEYNNKVKLAYEKDMLKMYISGHPLSEFEDQFSYYTFNTSMIGLDDTEEIEEESELDDVTKTKSNNAVTIKDNATVTLGGIITSVDKRRTRDGKIMAILELEDFYDSIKVIVFPRQFSSFQDILKEDNIIEVTGSLQLNDGPPSIRASSINSIQATTQNGNKKALFFFIDDKTMHKYEQIINLLKREPGPYNVYAQYIKTLYSTEISVKNLENAARIVTGILGPMNVKIVDDIPDQNIEK